MHLIRKYMLTLKKKKPEDLPDFLQNEIILDDYKSTMLRQLKGWIRKKQIEHMKAGEKDGRAGHETRKKEACPTIEDRPPKDLLAWL